jgi:hypothetical protein
LTTPIAAGTSNARSAARGRRDDGMEHRCGGLLRGLRDAVPCRSGTEHGERRARESEGLHGFQRAPFFVANTRGFS